MTNVRLPDTFVDAKEIIISSFEDSNKINIKSYNSIFTKQADLVHYHIDEENKTDESDSNMDIVLVYKQRVLTIDNKFDEVEKVRNLRVLTAYGDTKWTYRMISRIWEGNYPSTVAIDRDTGEVLFFNISLRGIELVPFGKLDALQFDAVKESLNDRAPFKIKICSDAMFNFIDGEEGLGHLKRNIIVEFDCAIPVEVRYNFDAVI